MSPEKIRIAHVITRYVPGGAQRILQTLLTGLNPQRYELILICGAEDLDASPLWKNQLQAAGVALMILPEMVRSISPIKDLHALFKLIRIFQSKKPDLVHTHTSKAGILGRLAARFAGVKFIVHTPHGIIYQRGSRIEGVPDEGWVTWILKTAERICGKFTNGLITLTESERLETIQFGLGKAENVFSISNAIDAEAMIKKAVSKSEARIRFHLPEDKFIIGTLGRFSRVKGHHEFLTAALSLAKKNTHLHFVFAGAGPEEKPLKDRVKISGMESQISFPGYVENPGEILPAFDLFVLPSLYEGFGIAILETWCLKLPVLATPVGGIPEILEHQKNGWITEAASAEALEKGIAEMIQQPRSILQELGNQGYATLIHKFHLKGMIQKHEKLYEQVLTHV